MMPRLTWLVVGLSLAAGCDGCTKPGKPAADAGPSADGGLSSAAPVPTTTSSVGPWAAAAAGDELAAMRLAEIHTAPELVAIARGGPQADAALVALRHANDAELALADLARLATDTRRGEAALRTIVAIAARPTRHTEPLDPDGLATCIERLQTLSRDAQAPRPRRVLAVDALRGFARAGYVDAEGVTTELD
jgi:hypothetical protein